MTRGSRTAAVLTAALLSACTACTDPHSGDWTDGDRRATPQATTATQAPVTQEPAGRSTASEEPAVEPGPTAGSSAGLTALEQWLLDGFVAGGYPEASVRVHGSADAWVAGGLNQNAPERFAHAWPTAKTDLYADEGTVLRSARIADIDVQVLQHVWGVSARFECGDVMVDTYAQSQVAQNQAEAEALSLAEVLIDPLACAEGGFQP